MFLTHHVCVLAGGMGDATQTFGIQSADAVKEQIHRTAHVAPAPGYLPSKDWINSPPLSPATRWGLPDQVCPWPQTSFVVSVIQVCCQAVRSLLESTPVNQQSDNVAFLVL